MSANKEAKKRPFSATQRPPPADTEGCKFLIVKKNKYCSRLPLKQGSIYCGMHVEHDKEFVEKNNLKRIPCPLDPAHTIFEHELTKHLKICTTAKQKNTKQSQPFFDQDCNLSDVLSEEISKQYENAAKPLSSKTKKTTSPSANNSGTQLFQLLNTTLTQESFESLKNKIEKVYEEMISKNPIQEEILRPAICERTFLEGATTKQKHLAQEASLVGQLEKNKLLNDAEYCYMEFGAGRAELSFMVSFGIDQLKKQQSSTNTTSTTTTTESASSSSCARCKMLLVDRAHMKGKLDNEIRRLLERGQLQKFKKVIHGEEPQERSPYMPPPAKVSRVPVFTASEKEAVQRIYIDIKDLNLAKVEPVHNQRCVVISKHLCGIATDLTLRCVAKPRATLAPYSLDAVMIALCCHQICSWHSYINQEFFLQHGFDEKDFEAIKLLSSWAICSFNRHSKNQQQATTEPNNSNTSTSQQQLPGETASQQTTIPSTEEEEDEKVVFEEAANNKWVTAMSNEERIVFGDKCKRLIDFGRVEFLKKLGYSTRLIYYVTKNTSPENVMLVGIKQN